MFLKKHGLWKIVNILLFGAFNARFMKVSNKTRMSINDKKPYYLVAIGFFILLKFGYTVANNDNLMFLIKPIDAIVGILTGSHSIYFSDKGYYHEGLNILIGKSCSGFNFMLLCFCMLAFLFLKYADKALFKILTLPFALIIAYFLTVFVNASRIFVSIIIQQQANSFLPDRPHLILHEIVGVLTNLTFLILIYIALEKFLTNKYPNEKLA